jgi:hypothetical protein
VRIPNRCSTLNPRSDKEDLLGIPHILGSFDLDLCCLQGERWEGGFSRICLSA